MANALDEQQVQAFDVPAQPLAAALKQLAEQAELQILFEEKAVAGLQSAPVSGTMSVRQALQRLLGTAAARLEIAENGNTIVIRSGARSPNAARADDPPGAATPRRRSPAAETASTGHALEEVVVTAQKREERLQDVPIAVSAFSAEDLAQLNVYRPSDLAAFTPNMVAERQPGTSATANYTIRGITQTEPSMSVDQGVAVYLNGVYIARNNGLVMDFADLERVEVLRGPQGTLYGRNSTGGAVNIITARPSGELGLKQKLTFGNLGRFRSITTVDSPEWHGISARLAYMSNESNGYVDNETVDFQQGRTADFGAIDQDAVYLAVHGESGRFAADYQFDWSESRNVPPVFQLTFVDVNRARGFVNSIFGPSFFDSPAGAAIRTTYEQGAALVSDRRADGLNVPYAGYEDEKIYGHALTLAFNVSDSMALKSITGYRKMDITHRTDFSGGASAQTPSGTWIALFAGGGDADRGKHNDQFSQEFQIVGSLARIDYVGGLYYFKEESNAGGSSQVSVNFGNWGAPGITESESTAWAAFVQGTYRLTDRTEITAGLRYTEDDKKVLQGRFDSTIGDFRTQRFQKDFGNLSGSVALDYEWTPDVSTYGRIATGYKSGGFLDRIDVIAQRPFDEEKLISYELGLKSEWFGRRLRLNAAAFYSNYDDLQVSQFVPSASGAQSIISNAGEAEYRGVELELLASPIESLVFNLSYGYLDPKYKQYEFFDPTGQFCGAPLTTCDVADRAHFPVTPEHTAAFGVQHVSRPFGSGTLTARVDVTYNDGYLHGTIDTPTDRFVKADAHTMFNARLALSDLQLSRGIDLELALWGRNLGDEEYISYGIASFDALGFAGGIFNEPRTYGLDVTVRF